MSLTPIWEYIKAVYYLQAFSTFTQNIIKFIEYHYEEKTAVFQS